MEHGEPLRVGEVEISVVCQGWAPLPLAEECPGHDVDWPAERERHPGMFAGAATWQWHVHGFVVRTPSGVTMVDTGLGGAPPYAPWPPGQGKSADEAYAEAGVDPSEVTTVVLTHMHPDHSGGVGGPDGEPRFVNARHVLHPADWEFLHRDDVDDYSALARPWLDRTHELGMLDLDPDDRQVAAGIRVAHSPGHTPGHRSALLDAGETTVLLTGDLLHLPIQVANPSWPSSHDEEPEEGARSRTALLERGAQEAWTIAVPHFTRSFGGVGANAWKER